MRGIGGKRHMPLPLGWPKGPPEVNAAAEIFIDSYCIAYRPEVTTAAGEDWCLGHHTREGKQQPARPLVRLAANHGHPLAWAPTGSLRGSL